MTGVKPVPDRGVQILGHNVVRVNGLSDTLDSLKNVTPSAAINGHFAVPKLPEYLPKHRVH